MKIITMIMAIALLAGGAVAEDFGGVTFLMISAEDQTAVARDPQGKLKLLKAGDLVDEDLRVIGFEENLVILEGPGGWAPIKYLVEVTEGRMQVTKLARRPLEKHVFRGGEVKSFQTKSH